MFYFILLRMFVLMVFIVVLTSLALI